MQQLKIDNEVINHLLFHKSLIDEKEDASKINQYLSLVKNDDEVEHITIDDPFDRSIAIAFELVIQHHMNPWDIDLVSFSTIYLKKAKDEKIDLITAGRIIYMAWKVLKLQSDDLVLSAETKKQEYEPLDWGDIPTDFYLTKDDPYSYTNLVMNSPQSPLDEPLRRDATRKVTLMELVNAFDQARKESEEHVLLEMQRKEESERLTMLARKRMKGTAHEDHLEVDVLDVWNRIEKFKGKTIQMTELCEKDGREEIIKVLISVLFLAYDNKIDVYQKEFPYGKIFIKNIEYT